MSVKESLKQCMWLTAKPLLPKPKAVLIKSGQKRLAEMVNRAGALTIKFSDPNLAASLMTEIEALIRAKGCAAFVYVVDLLRVSPRNSQ